MRVQRGNSHIANLFTATISRACWTLPVTSCSCRVPRPSWTEPSGRISLPPAGLQPHVQAAMTSPAHKKKNLAIRGVLHASTRALPVRNLHRAPCEQSTPRRSRRVSHTCSRTEPIQSESSYPAWPLSVRGISYITTCVSGPGLTLAAVHVGVSSVARHGPPVRYRADPGRSQMQLQPLLGICSATVAVFVSIRATRSCVSRRPDCTQHSNSHRETQPHAHAWRPTSPVCTVTAHTRCLEVKHGI